MGSSLSRRLARSCIASSRIGWRFSGIPVESIRGTIAIVAVTRLLRLGFLSADVPPREGYNRRGACGEKGGMKLHTQKLLQHEERCYQEIDPRGRVWCH